MRHRLVLFALALALALAAAPLFAQNFSLHDGDRVVFYGDSITQDGGYAVLVEQYVVTRFPSWDVAFTHAGVGGDKVTGGGMGDVDTRLERDVFPSDPTVLTVMLGMNDGGYKPFDAMGLARYKDGMEHILTRTSAVLPGVRLTVLRPGAYDDVTRPKGFPGGYDDVLRRHGCVAEGVGRARGATIVDMRTALNDALRKLEAEAPDLAPLLIPDRVHPSAAGHLVMGASLLRAWKAPEVITSVEIDAATARVGATTRTTVSGLERTEKGLRWAQQDEALPMPHNPTDAEVVFADRAGARLLELNQQSLRVAGLADGRYSIRIDGKEVATVASADLASGINLSAFPNPMLERARRARWLIPGLHEITRLRRKILASASDDPRARDSAAFLAERRLADRREARRQIQPGAHLYEVAMVR